MAVVVEKKPSIITVIVISMNICEYLYNNNKNKRHSGHAMSNVILVYQLCLPFLKDFFFATVKYYDNITITVMPRI